MPGLFGVDMGANANEHRDELTIWRVFNCLEMVNEKKSGFRSNFITICFIIHRDHRYSGYRGAACVVKLAWPLSVSGDTFVVLSCVKYLLPDILGFAFSVVSLILNTGCQHEKIRYPNKGVCRHLLKLCSHAFQHWYNTASLRPFACGSESEVCVWGSLSVSLPLSYSFSLSLSQDEQSHLSSGLSNGSSG